MNKPKPKRGTSIQSEDEWEEVALEQSLRDAVEPDGDIDFDTLRAAGQTMAPDELYPEGSADDES